MSTEPVALYPDALLAEVLVASTYPGDVVAAAQWLDAGNNPASVDDQDWDLSVKGVARFPDLLHYMAANGDWMNELGEAFINQEPDVMNAVQALRGEAPADGSLASNDQQQVIVDGSTIEIVPTNPQEIYLPIYDPQAVYVANPYPVGTVVIPRIRFGPGIRVGDWLHHDFDWHDRAVYVGSWGRPALVASRAGQGLGLHARPAGSLPPGRDHPSQRSQSGDERAWRPLDVADARRRKPMPRPVARPAGRQPQARPGTGYPPRAEPAAGNPGAANRGARSGSARDVWAGCGRARAKPREVRKAAREPPPRRLLPLPGPHRRGAAGNARSGTARATGASRTRTRAARAAVAIVRDLPHPRSPHRGRPRAPRAPPPAARPSAPVRGGAVAGYQSGPQAAANSSRAPQSRRGFRRCPRGGKADK